MSENKLTEASVVKQHLTTAVEGKGYLSAIELRRMQRSLTGACSQNERARL